MNSRQFQYAIMLSETLNFSQVAEKLNISQPALSKQILSLENELGVRLFDRGTTPLTLTAAGEHFIREAQELLFREDQLKRSMEDFRSGERGRLVIGITPFRSQYLIPPIAKKLRDKYPGVQIILHEAGSDILRKEAAEGKYDFAVINLPVDDSVLDITPIEPDTLVLAVPNSMLNLLPQDPEGQLPEINIAACKDLPFVVVGQNQELRKHFEKLCATADTHPQIAMEVVGITTAWTMSRAGIGAALLPKQLIDDDHRDRVTLFKLTHDIYARQPAVVTRKGQYISQYAKYAISLLTSADNA